MKRKMASLALAAILMLQAPVGVFAQKGSGTEEQPAVVEEVKKETPDTDGKKEEVVKFTVTIELQDEEGNTTVQKVEEVEKGKDFQYKAKSENFEKWIVTRPTGEKVTVLGRVLTIENIEEDIVAREVVKEKPAPVDQKLVADYLSKVKYVNGVTEGKMALEVPDVPEGYTADVNILLKDTLVVQNKNVTEGKNIELNYSKDPYSVAVKFVRTADKVESEVEKKNLTSPEISAPKLNYAYVFDGGLVINVTADMGIKDVYWAYKGEKDFTKLPLDAGYGRKYSYRPVSENKNSNDFSGLFEVHEEKLDKYTRLNTSDYRINLRIPATVNIVVVDKLDNKTPITMKVEKDNTVLTKNVPEDVVKALKKAMNFTFEGNEKYEDLIIVEKNTTVDMFETFEKYIVKQLDRFNTRDLSWRFENDDKENIPYTGVYKFTKAGNFIVVVKDLESGREAKMTVLVNEGRNNLRSYKVTKDKVELKEDKFKGLDALKDIVKYENKENVNALGLVMKVDGKYYKIDEEITFGDKKEVKATIIDLKDNKTYEVTFVKKAPVTANEITDIKGHWAESLIKKLVDRGVIQGYEDKTFKPDNNITIRETLAILGRYAEQNEKNTNAVVRDYKILEEKDAKGKENWGYKEVTYAMNRLNTNIFANKDISRDAITREEVAYVLDCVFKIQRNGEKVELTDVNISKYAAEVENLITNGVIKGYPDKTFKPADKITRAELSSLLFNMPAEFK